MRPLQREFLRGHRSDEYEEQQGESQRTDTSTSGRTYVGEETDWLEPSAAINSISLSTLSCRSAPSLTARCMYCRLVAGGATSTGQAFVMAAATICRETADMSASQSN